MEKKFCKLGIIVSNHDDVYSYCLKNSNEWNLANIAKNRTSQAG